MESYDIILTEIDKLIHEKYKELIRIVERHGSKDDVAPFVRFTMQGIKRFTFDVAYIQFYNELSVDDFTGQYVHIDLKDPECFNKVINEVEVIKNRYDQWNQARI